MRNIIVGLIICVSTHVVAQQHDEFVYLDNNQPIEKRVDDLLNRMTLEEKLAQIRHLHSWDVFDGQKLNTVKLAKMCGEVGYGFLKVSLLQQKVAVRTSGKYKLTCWRKPG